MQNKKLTIAVILALAISTSMTVGLQREVSLLKQEVTTEKGKSSSTNKQNTELKKSLENLTGKNIELHNEVDSSNKKINELKKQLERLGMPEDF